MAEIFRRFSGIRVSHFMGMCVGQLIRVILVFKFHMLLVMRRIIFQMKEI